MRHVSLLAVALMLAAGLASSSPVVPSLTTPASERRGADHTYLTFPEWFLVFSPDEYADMLQAGRSPSRFPFFAHIGQFWQAYGRVIDSVWGRYAFNGEYHTMIVVIGTSTTVEYGLRGSYETLLGRLSELTAAPLATPEDRLAAKQARDYVEFIRVRPWYEFDFMTPLGSLWRDVPWHGPHLLRKWERRYLLTSDWLIKAGYAAVLERATHSAFELPKDTTAAVIRGSPTVPAAGVRALLVEGELTLALVPRYQAFTAAATVLAQQGASFEEIAGNRGDILVSTVMPMASPVPLESRVLFRQPILTRPGFERRVLETPIPALAQLLVDRAHAGDEVEHVFDF